MSAGFLRLSHDSPHQLRARRQVVDHPGDLPGRHHPQVRTAVHHRGPEQHGRVRGEQDLAPGEVLAVPQREAVTDHGAPGEPGEPPEARRVPEGAQGLKLEDAIITACKVRLRPILMTTLATVLGLIPMALALEAGSEQYAPLARAILGGLTVSGVVTVFLVPSAYLVIHRNIEARKTRREHPEDGQVPAHGAEVPA